jgi:DNA-directed RNA polymerase subunit RPC12/RpoP
LEYKCHFCGKELKNQGSVNLHERKCPKNPGNVKHEENHGVCQHEFRLLNPKNPAENRAIQAGYSEVCKHCKELQE